MTVWVSQYLAKLKSVSATRYYLSFPYTTTSELLKISKISTYRLRHVNLSGSVELERCFHHKLLVELYLSFFRIPSPRVNVFVASHPENSEVLVIWHDFESK